MNTDSEINELIVLNKKFSEELDNSYFAGDIVVDQEDLLQISKKIKDNFFYHQIKNLSSLLLVLAVNTAYYYYDEHGFWKHFNDLTSLAKNIYDQEYMGNIFEDVLLFKNLISKKRSGPFRYVGAILGQIGVTKRNLLSYAEIIRKMVYETNISKVLEKDFKYYSNFIRANCSNSYLKKYLLDDSGWNFTNQVFKIIHYLNKGILEIDKIPHLKGFHLDFWKNFFDFYFENDLRRLEVLEFKKPKLFYDSNLNKLYLKFFSSNTRILDPNIVNFNTITFRDNFAYFLNKIEEFHFKYSGYYKKNNSQIEWEIPGWDIINKSFALFDERKGYIETEDLETLAWGTYYIISHSDFLIPPLEYKTEFINKLNIENRLFKVFKAVIYNTKKEFEQTNIYWQKKPDLILHGNLYEIFFNDLPDLTIVNQHLLEDNSELLLFDIGNGIERVFDYKNLSELRKATKDEEAYIGKIWTERLGIFKTSDLSEHFNELNFCVIPESEVQLPSEIYIADEYIKFTCNSKYIHFNNCDFDQEIQKYIINPKTNLIEGHLSIDKRDIDFHHLIDRIDIFLNEDSKLKYIDLLENKISNFKIIGKPDLKLEFGISILESDIILLKDVLLNKEGEYYLEYSKILTKLESITINVGRFFIKINENILYFNKGIINYSKLLEDFSEIEKLHSQKEIIHFIDENLFEKIDILFKIFNNEYFHYDYSLLDNDKIFNKIYIISSILNCKDFSTLKIKKEEIINLMQTNSFHENTVDALIWFIKSNIAIGEHQAEEFGILINQYEKLKWKPFFYKWKEILLNVLNILNDLSDGKSMMLEWHSDIRSKRVSKFSSKISNFYGGSLITRAWKKYIEGKNINSLKLLKLIENENGYINNLKILLICLIYLKNFRLKSIIKLTDTLEGQDEITEIIVLIRNTAILIVGKNHKNNTDLGYKPMKTIPFLEQDKKLLERIRILLNQNNSVQIKEEKDMKFYWLLKLVEYKLCKDSKQRKILFKKIKSIFYEIPSSPEKKDLLKEFYV